MEDIKDSDGTRGESEGRGIQHVVPKWIKIWTRDMGIVASVLSNEQAGEIFKALCKYALTGEITPIPEKEVHGYIFSQMLDAAKQSVNDYSGKAERGRQNGKGASKSEEGESQEAETNQQDSNKSPPQKEKDAFSRFNTYFPSAEKIEEQKENAPLPEEDAPLSESVNRLLQGFKEQNGCYV